MKFIPSLGEFSTKGKAAFKRFPIVISWAIIGTVFVLFQIEFESIDATVTTNIIITFALGVSWFIAARFFIEQFQSNKNWLFVFSFLFLGVFYISLSTQKNLTNTEWVRFMLYLFSGHLLVFVAPFVLKWQKEAYFNYLNSVFVAIVRSSFFSMILYLGIILALAAFENLFNFDIDSKRYFQILVICLGIVNTWIYLSDFPKEIYTQTSINYSKALEVFVKYILIPLVILYLVILYAYGFKILINWNLPKGWVSYLVIALSFLGFIIQICINPIQKTIDSRAINRFYPWFYRLLFPLLILLFVAIFRRISEYGVTENRYFVLVISLWILAMTLYMLFSKRKQIRVFPMSLAMLVLVISVGFWSVFSVSTKSQVKMFSKVFHQLKEKEFKISSDEKQQFKSIIKYLGKKKQLAKISPVLGYNPVAVFNTDSYWEIQRKIADSLQLKVTDFRLEDIVEKARNTYYQIDKKEQLTFNIKGYDFFKQFYFAKKSKNKPIAGYQFSVSLKNNEILIEKEAITYQINLDSFIEELVFKDENYNIPLKNMQIIKEFETLSVQIIFTNLTIVPKSKEQVKATFKFGNAYIMLKEKTKENE